MVLKPSILVCVLASVWPLNYPLLACIIALSRFLWKDLGGRSACNELGCFHCAETFSFLFRVTYPGEVVVVGYLLWIR